LRDRLAVEEVAELAAQLPILVRASTMMVTFQPASLIACGRPMNFSAPSTVTSPDFEQWVLMTRHALYSRFSDGTSQKASWMR
jgi:hypothetical protein